jgi:hypothetical protein
MDQKWRRQESVEGLMLNLQEAHVLYATRDVLVKKFIELYELLEMSNGWSQENSLLPVNQACLVNPGFRTV